MKTLSKIALTIAATAALATAAHAQISFTLSPYNENFDSMASTATYGTTGWTGIRSAGTGTIDATLVPTVTDGGSITGGTDNLGTTAAADRALGELASGTTAAAFGAVLTNDTGNTLTSLDLAFFAEQWRTGNTNTVNEVWTFQLQVGAIAITNAAFATPFTSTALNINEILTTTTSSAAVDGNAAANRIAVSGTANGFSIAPGQTFAIRWVDADNTGTDAAMGIDDFIMVPEPSIYMLLGVGLLLCGQRFLRRKFA